LATTAEPVKATHCKQAGAKLHTMQCSYFKHVHFNYLETEHSQKLCHESDDHHKAV